MHRLNSLRYNLQPSFCCLLKGFVSLLLSFVASEFLLGQTSVPARLLHRWEHEPNLGADWRTREGEPIADLEAERIVSSQKQIRLSEAQEAILQASNSRLTGRQQVLPVIIEQLKTDRDNRHVRLALASAAIQLSDGTEAQVLWELLRDQALTRDHIERALVRWKSPVALESWRKRLTDAPHTPELLTAIEGIEASGDASDRDSLEALLRGNELAHSAKLLVGRALGKVVAADLEHLAKDVLQTDIAHQQLIAAYLLSGHRSLTAGQLLEQLTESDSLPARFIAYKALAENFPDSARRLADRMLDQPDNTSRKKAIEVLNRYDDLASLRLQAVAIEDKNREIRLIVRKNLEHKAAIPELNTFIDEVIAHHLSGTQYLATEQVILLAVSLEKRQFCPRFVSLLEHPRPQVQLTAAWALQELADSPDILKGILAHCRPWTDKLSKIQPVEHTDIFRLAYLFEALGRNRYEPAKETLMVYIPKDGQKMGDTSRTSAIWALGYILQGTQDAVIARKLGQRLLDASVDDPESETVKYTSAIAMGLIKAPASREQLLAAPDAPPSPVGLAVQWALEQF